MPFKGHLWGVTMVLIFQELTLLQCWRWRFLLCTWNIKFVYHKFHKRKSVVVRKRSTLGLHSSNCTFNLKYCNYWYNLLFIPSVDHICFYVGGRCILLFVPFYRFYVWMSGFLLKYIFIKLYLLCQNFKWSFKVIFLASVLFIFKDGVYTQLHDWLQLKVEFKGRLRKQFHLLCDKIFKFSSISEKDSLV